MNSKIILRIVGSVLSASLALSCSIGVYAADNNAEDTTVISENTIDAVRDEVSTDFSAEDETQQDLSIQFGADANKNLAMISSQYNNLMKQFDDKGFGTKTFEVPEFDLGYSGSVTDLFNSSFGDLKSQLTLTAPTIPEGFTVSNMMNQANAARNSFVGDFRSSEAYQNTMSQMSIGSVFSRAEQGLSMPSLYSADEMNSMLSGLSDVAKAQQESEDREHASYVAEIESQNKYNANPNDLNSAASRLDYRNMQTYNDYVADVADWLNDNYSREKDEIDEIYGEDFVENKGQIWLNEDGTPKTTQGETDAEKNERIQSKLEEMENDGVPIHLQQYQDQLDLDFNGSTYKYFVDDE